LAHCLESTPRSHSQCPSSQISGVGVALAHDATQVNAVAGVQSPSTSELTSRAVPSESADRFPSTSAASELTDEELALQLTKRTATRITPVALTSSEGKFPGGTSKRLSCRIAVWPAPFSI
jgi:hypothetical protein